MAAALAAKEELEAVQNTIREGTAWPDEEVLTRRDQARRKLVEAVRRVAAEWREQEAAAVQQRCMHWSQQLMEVLLKVGKDRTMRKEADLKEKEKEKETETEEAADELQSGTEALKKFQEWQEIHAEQQQVMEAETESHAQKVSNAFHRVAFAFSDTNESATEEELLLKDNHMASLINAIHKEQDFLKGGVGDGPPLRALSQGIRGVINYLQKMCKEERDKDVMLMTLMKEKMEVKRVMANPPNYQLLKDLQRANKKSLVKVRVAKAEMEGADDDEEREAAQVMLAKAKTQLRQQALLLEREALQLVELSNSYCPESRFLLKELGLEAVDLMAVDCPYRRLDHYDHIQVLSSTGHHCVMKAQYQGQACVLKEFDLSSTDHQHFMRELKRLRSLQHEHIAKVEAAFVQKEDGRIKGYIHMPFYSGGNLCEWLTNGREDRNDAEKQRVGRGVLLALQHIHSQGIVHRDVKPQNIFVEEEGKEMGNDEEENEGNGGQHGRQRAILGDFDISSHAATGTMTMVADGSGGGGGGRSGSEGGGTWAYMAPEVCCGEVGPAADVFSCGLLLFDLHFAVPSLQAQAQAQEARGEGGREMRPARPTLMEMVKGQEVTIPPHPNPHLRDLLHQVLQLDAKKRPTASQCLSHPYLWTHLVEHRVAERDRRSCVVCMDEKWLDEGLQCLPPPSSSPLLQAGQGEEPHFVCGGCLNGWAVSLLDMPAAVLAKMKRELPCLVSGCAAQPFPMEQLMAHVEDEGRKALLEVRSRATEFMSEQAFQQRLAQERELWEKQSTAQRHRRCMVEDILTLQCPRCHQAFVDFDGCFALTCSRCNAAFCAWCLQDCGKNAHRHVRGCAHNLAGGNVFGSFEQFEEGQRRRRERKVREYLNGLEREEREQVAAGLKKELEDLNIHL
ncbi:IBR domain-containing protein [Balamuthia mandrillaris]